MPPGRRRNALRPGGCSAAFGRAGLFSFCGALSKRRVPETLGAKDDKIVGNATLEAAWTIKKSTAAKAFPGVAAQTDKEHGPLSGGRKR